MVNSESREKEKEREIGRDGPNVDSTNCVNDVNFQR